MKKKIMTLLLALGCVLGVGTATACATGNSAAAEANCQHQNAHYVLVENEDGWLQPCIDCEDCIGRSWPEVRKSECRANVTEAVPGKDGYTVYTYVKEGRTYTSEALDSTHEHDILNCWTVESGTLCEDGGDFVKKCASADCGYATKAETMGAQGHYSNHWDFASEEDKPTYLKGGVLTGVCNDWKDALVNGANYSGCGETITMEIPALSENDYDVVVDGVCGCSGALKCTYKTEVQGQTISFEVDLATQKHILKDKYGVLEAPEPYHEILLTAENIKRYGGVDDSDKVWEFFSGETSTCSQSREAAFICAICGQRPERIAPLVIVTPHTEPTDKDAIQIDPTLDCENENKKHYNCAICNQDVYEAIEHDFEYTLTIDEVTDTYSVEGVCVNGCSARDDDSGELKANAYLKEKNPVAATCAADGSVEYVYKKNGKTSNTVTLILSNEGILHRLNDKEMDTSKAYDYAEGAGFHIVDDGGIAPCMRGEGGTLGVFYCGKCSEPVKVNLTVGHTKNKGDVGSVVEEPTCDKKGWTEYACKYCSDTFTVENVAPKGHDFLYVYVGRTAEFDYLFERVCVCGVACSKSNWERITVKRASCTATELNPISCTEGWTTKFDFTYAETDGSISNGTCKTYFTPAHGVMIDGEYVKKPYYDREGNVIVYKLADEPEGGIQWLGDPNKAPCEEDGEAEGWFRCACCDELIKVRVEVEHTEPEGLSADATEYECDVCHATVSKEEEE